MSPRPANKFGDALGDVSMEHSVWGERWRFDLAAE